MNPLYIPVFENEPNVRAFFSTKEGSSLKSPYYNESVLKELNLLKYPIIWPTQVHKDHIEVIKDTTFKTSFGSSTRIICPGTDGLVTNCTGVVLTTVHADCLAVFFYDPFKKVIGLVHAGWRGSSLGIAVNAVNIMKKEFSCNPKDILCFISPGISQCCFETGPEVLATFQEKWEWAEEYSIKKGDKNYLDLKGINARQLSLSGVNKIQVSEFCTCCSSDIFCSYRKEAGITNRMGAGISLI